MEIEMYAYSPAPNDLRPFYGTPEPSIEFEVRKPAEEYVIMSEPPADISPETLTSYKSFDDSGGIPVKSMPEYLNEYSVLSELFDDEYELLQELLLNGAYEGGLFFFSHEYLGIFGIEKTPTDAQRECASMLIALYVSFTDESIEQCDDSLAFADRLRVFVRKNEGLV